MSGAVADQGGLQEVNIRFTGTPRFREDGSAYVSENEYTGMPSVEIDKAWTELYQGESLCQCSNRIC